MLLDFNLSKEGEEILKNELIRETQWQVSTDGLLKLLKLTGNRIYLPLTNIYLDSIIADELISKKLTQGDVKSENVCLELAYNMNLTIHNKLNLPSVSVILH